MPSAITFDPFNIGQQLTLSNVNRTVDSTITAYRNAWVTQNTPIQYDYKYYWEIYANSLTTTLGAYVGVAAIDGSLNPENDYAGKTTDSVGYRNSTGAVYHNASIVDTYDIWATGDILQMAFDPGTNSVWFGLNNVWNGDPAAGTGAAVTGLIGDYIPVVTMYHSTAQLTGNFNTSHQTYTAPGGFNSNEYSITGYVTVGGAPDERVVRAYHYDSGQLEGNSTSSSVDGSYNITTYTADTCYVIHVEDNNQVSRSVVRDFITPTPITA